MLLTFKFLHLILGGEVGCGGVYDAAEYHKLTAEFLFDCVPVILQKLPDYVDASIVGAHCSGRVNLASPQIYHV